MRQQAAKIHAQTVASQIMPLGNITQMTPEERQLIGVDRPGRPYRMTVAPCTARSPLDAGFGFRP